MGFQNQDSSELAKLRKLLNILLSVSAILAVVLITLGVTKIIKYVNTGETDISIPVVITNTTESTTYTEPIVYHTEQLARHLNLPTATGAPSPRSPKRTLRLPNISK